MARFSKEEIKRMIAARPADLTPQDVIDSLLAKGHDLEGYVHKGPQGERGPEGPRGPMGPMGPQGLPGIQGAQGPMGPCGKDGRDGRDGRDGEDGKEGPAGKDAPIINADELVEKINTAANQIDPLRIRDLQAIVQGFNVGHPETQIRAGSNITVTKDAFGNWIITSTASGGSSFLAATGTVDGVNTSFTFSSAPSAIVVDQGRSMQKVSSDGTVNWTGTTSVTLTMAPNYDIYGFG